VIGQKARDLLFDQIADHAFGLGVEDVQGVGCCRVVGRTLQGQQPYLRAVAVGDHHIVLLG